MAVYYIMLVAWSNHPRWTWTGSKCVFEHLFGIPNNHVYIIYQMLLFKNLYENEVFARPCPPPHLKSMNVKCNSYINYLITIYIVATVENLSKKFKKYFFDFSFGCLT